MARKASSSRYTSGGTCRVFSTFVSSVKANCAATKPCSAPSTTIGTLITRVFWDCSTTGTAAATFVSGPPGRYSATP